MNFKYVTLLLCVILLNLLPHQSESRETTISLQKLAYDRQMLEAPHRRTGAYDCVRDYLRSGVTTQLPFLLRQGFGGHAEVEFPKRSIRVYSNKININVGNNPVANYYMITTPTAESSEAIRVYGDQMNIMVGNHSVANHYMITTPNLNNQHLKVTSYHVTVDFKDTLDFTDLLTYKECTARANTNAKLIADNIDINPNTFFGLQGLDTNDKHALKNAFQNYHQFASIHTATKGTNVFHGIIYNSYLYNCISESSNDLIYLNTLRSNNGKNNIHRYLHLVLRHKHTKEIYNVVNIHLRSYCHPPAIAQALNVHAQTLGNFIVMGDFQGNMSTCSIPTMTTLVSTNGYLCNNIEHTTDAIIYKLSNPPSSPPNTHPSPSNTHPFPPNIPLPKLCDYKNYALSLSVYANIIKDITEYIAPSLHDHSILLIRKYPQQFIHLLKYLLTLDKSIQVRYWAPVLPILDLIYSRKYENNYYTPLSNEHQDLIKNRINGCVQSNVITLLTLYPSSFTYIVSQMIAMTPTGSATEFEKQKQIWEPIINYLMTSVTQTPILKP